VYTHGPSLSTTLLHCRYIPGNEAKCIAQEQCNYEPESLFSKANCESGSTNMCAQCYGPFCYEISQPKRCEVGGLDWNNQPQPDSNANAGTCNKQLAECKAEYESLQVFYWDNMFKDDFSMANMTVDPAKCNIDTACR
jgi:hypothetical protein